MSSLKQKHLKFLSTVDYWDERFKLLKENILKDSTGAFWHKDEVICYMEKYLESKDYLDINKEHKLSGLAVGVKDLFCIKGLHTTAGSRILSDFVSPYTSTLWERISAKGGVLAGKLSMDEFAMGSFTNTSYLGRTSIPDYPEHTAGGSSGGSAAAVASGVLDFSIGSDTGGSVRLPASFCSIVGYKPSYGAFSRFGMIPYASSLDQAGFFTRTLEDLQYVLSSQIAEKDEKDMTCVGLGQYSESTKKITKVGYFKEMLEDTNIEPEVLEAYKKTLKDMESIGIETVPIKIKFMEQAAQIYYIIACSEASSNLARYQGVYYGAKLSEETAKESFSETISDYRSKYFGVEVQKRIMLGSFILSSENFTAMYQKACDMREILRESMKEVLKTVDTIVLPVSPYVSPKWSEIDQMTSAQIYLSDFMTVPFSLAGVPALSLPWYKNKDGLGIGIQFVGRQFEDYELIDSLKILEDELSQLEIK